MIICPRGSSFGGLYVAAAALAGGVGRMRLGVDGLPSNLHTTTSHAPHLAGIGALPFQERILAPRPWQSAEAKNDDSDDDVRDRALGLWINLFYLLPRPACWSEIPPMDVLFIHI